jgi:hypothetical protein
MISSHEERLTEDGQESYLDYLITTAQTSLLVEAKRAQVNFTGLPSVRRAPPTRLMDERRYT